MTVRGKETERLETDEHEIARERKRSSASRFVNRMTAEGGRESLGLARTTRERERRRGQMGYEAPGGRDEISAT